MAHQSFPISAFTLETFASVRLEVMDAGNNRIGAGSGFAAKFGGRYYLITARHVLLGEASAGQIGQHSARARFINTNCFVVEKSSSGYSLENRAIFLDLYKPDGRRNWNETFDWDVASIDIAHFIDNSKESIISIDLSEVSVQVNQSGEPISVTADEDLPGVGSDVFIVGYPGNLSYLTDNRSPLWKRSSIASEPHINLDGRPIFLVDTQGASGLSGSPVLYNGVNLISPMGERRTCNYTESRFHLVGVYCGREGYSKDAISLSMGRVFKRCAIQHVIMEPAAE